jgi:hypothetical protein
LNMASPAVTSSSKAKTEFKNPLQGEYDKFAGAKVTVAKAGLRVGFTFKF